jgi:hypothetical protein
MAQNLRLDEEMIPYWASYINERRCELELKSSTPPKSIISSNNHNSGKLFSIPMISQRITKIFFKNIFDNIKSFIDKVTSHYID